MGRSEVFHHFGAVALQTTAYVILMKDFWAGERPWCRSDYSQVDCYSPEGIRASRSNSTDLEVILPSYGQTGTTSVTVALRELGFRAFHADDFAVFSRAVMFDRVDPGLWARTVTRCRMEAMSLEPITDLLPLALRMSPKAKFVMTWRPYPSWWKSTTSTRRKELRFGHVQKAIVRGNSFVPWIESWDYLVGTFRRTRQRGDPFWGEFAISAYMYRLVCNGYNWPVTNVKDRGTFKSKAHEEAYLGHINEIRMLVPKERLLEFDVARHGWAELEGFLGLASGKAGTPFPRPRTKNMRLNEPLLENNLHISGWALFFFNAMHAANWFLLGVFLRLVAGAARLLAPAWGPQPLVGSRECWDAALEASPVVAVLEGVEPHEARPLAEALVAAGVRAFAVPLGGCGAAASLRLLAAALPADVAVGASGVLGEGEVREAHAAGGRFVLSPHGSAAVLGRARALGLVGIAGVCTPTEAHAALRRGADGLCILPAGAPSPERVRACLDGLPAGPSAVVMGGAEPEGLAGHLAAGASGVCVSGGLFRPGEGPGAAAARAEALLAACAR